MLAAPEKVKSITLRHPIADPLRLAILKRALLLMGLVAAPGWAQTSDPVSFYASKIKPLLADRCLSCHSQTAMGGLRLDSREAFRKGGASGPVVKPGPAENTLLMQVVTHTHARIKMPPGGKLPDADIQNLKTWVESGAHFETVEAPAVKGFDVEGRKGFWSFRPPVKRQPPAVRDQAWVKTPVDAFLLAAMEAKGVSPAPRADKRTLLRRVTLDLTGLPPTPAEYAAFLADDSPDAFATVVDRLLNSPHYGERWARHWLDVSRYVDTDGFSVAPDPFPNAWRYRDWVVAAFNQDLPYDQFVKAQLAGDLMDPPGEPKLAVALGFLSLGPWFKVVEPPKAKADQLQDRIDVVTRGMLGLTVACARCHDHKYDPIPTKDYYGIGGVLSSTEYKEAPLAPAEVVKAYHDAEARVKELEKQIADLRAKERREYGDRMAQQAGRYVLAAWGRKHGAPELAKDLDPALVERWAEYLVREHDHTLLGFWREVEKSSDRAAAEAASQRVQKVVDDLQRDYREISAYNERVIEESKKSTDPYDIFCKGCSAETKALPRNQYVLRGDLFDGKRSNEAESFAAGVLWLSDEELALKMSAESKAKLEEWKTSLEAAKKAVPKRYPFLHILTDAEKPGDMPLHRRGDPYTLGEIVPRRFLSVLGKPEAAPLAVSGSGRLELAEQIASRHNPLTARVFVNRVWAHHFGAGIVRTPSNFGAAGDRPSHPELLDYLAVTFMENGWSVKKLHREMLLSSAYAMSARASEKSMEADPDNRLFSRHQRRRMDAETLRDSMLAASGELKMEMGGPADTWDKKFLRRSLYGEVSRFRPERYLKLFDFPDPSAHAEQRVTTNTAVQRLFFLNSEFIKERAAALAARANSVDALYSLLFGRAPAERERAAAAQYVASADLAAFAQVLLASNEFSFVD